MSEPAKVPFGVLRVGVGCAAAAIIVFWLLDVVDRGPTGSSICGVIAMIFLLLALFLGWRHDVRRTRT